MVSKTQGRIVSALGRVGFLSAALIACPSALISSNRTPSKIVCRPDVPQTRRQELASKLSTITGWPEIGFDESGALQLGSNTSVGGSQMARGLLEQALFGAKVLILEDASNRQDVVFCRVVPGRWKNSSVEKPPAFVVLIDFADFDRLMGDNAALKSFDVGWGLLHEIDHVINDSADSEQINQPGDCEAHLNLMRRECDLPLRTDYFFTFFPHADQSDFKTRFVRLAFDHKDPITARNQRYWLIWDASLVGGLNPADQIAQRNWRVSTR